MDDRTTAFPVAEGEQPLSGRPHDEIRQLATFYPTALSDSCVTCQLFLSIVRAVQLNVDTRSPFQLFEVHLIIEKSEADCGIPVSEWKISNDTLRRCLIVGFQYGT